MGRLLRLLATAVVVAALALGGYAWIRSRRPADGGIKLVDVTLGSITEKAVAVGQIKPRVEFHVKSKISGIVKRCYVEVGDRVRPGAPLFDILPDPTPAELIEAQTGVATAQSAYTLAQAEYGRATRLSDEGVLSHDQLDAKRAAYEQAKIDLGKARDSLELTRKGRVTDGGADMESIIRAPAGGILLTRLVNPGDPVVPLTSYQAGTDLATLADMTDLIFKGTVDEIDVGKLKAGTPARIRIGALPESVVTGRMSRIAPQATEKDGARLFDVEIELDPAPGIVLRAGYSANADLIIREKKDVLTIPERLVTFEKDGAKAYVEVPGRGKDAPPVKLEVETGLSDGLNIEIRSGLQQGDKVVERPPREITG
ncbi:MAG TPA: efflux RND transporter periplasmic adaptor subunit [Candidatus Polarisedimenticolia bacterium]|nr:efflux RND transporter periplasmic adaptor subunit [Candidatus Polarisedimenticolia bacterium]